MCMLPQIMIVLYGKSYVATSNKHPCNIVRATVTLASFPGLLRGEGREGLVSTARACAFIIQILSDYVLIPHSILAL
jgi:hypothetical protein